VIEHRDYDAEETMAEESAAQAAPPMRTKDEIAVELMKFIAVQTGYGRGTAPAAGFSGRPAALTPEQHAEALLELFERCRRALDRQ
jgi:hypothetical protein